MKITLSKFIDKQAHFTPFVVTLNLMNFNKIFSILALIIGENNENSTNYAIFMLFLEDLSWNIAIFGQILAKNSLF